MYIRNSVKRTRLKTIQQRANAEFRFKQSVWWMWMYAQAHMCLYVCAMMYMLFFFYAHRNEHYAQVHQPDNMSQPGGWQHVFDNISANRSENKLSQFVQRKHKSMQYFIQQGCGCAVQHLVQNCLAINGLTLIGLNLAQFRVRY